MADARAIADNRAYIVSMRLRVNGVVVWIRWGILVTSICVREMSGVLQGKRKQRGQHEDIKLDHLIPTEMGLNAIG